MGRGSSRTLLRRPVVCQALAHAGITIALAVVVTGGAAAFSAEQSFACIGRSGFGCLSAAQNVLLFGPPVIMLVGAFGAFFRVYRAWRSEGQWTVWLAAGWLLFIVTLLFVSRSGGLVMSA